MIEVDAERGGNAARYREAAAPMQFGIAAHIRISSSLADYKPKAGSPEPVLDCPGPSRVARIPRPHLICERIPLSDNDITTEVVIIGAGPAGLSHVVELGLLGIKSHVVDTLKQAGGQCTELYPDKPIYDIPALPICGAQELVDRLLQQIKPFGAELHLGEEAVQLKRQDNGRFRVATAAGTVFDAGAVVIAAGVGSFQPRRLALEGVEHFEGKQIHYKIKNVADFHGRDLVIFGGGDSALDWALALAPKASSLALVHRRAEFRGAPASVAQMRELQTSGKLRLIEGLAQSVHSDAD